VVHSQHVEVALSRVTASSRSYDTSQYDGL
jgi:hypothetical protein